MSRNGGNTIHSEGIDKLRAQRRSRERRRGATDKR
nr:MAG TPA: hypothetical protein [Caudoviricetes sp.]